jgi:hypothetical protein
MVITTFYRGRPTRGAKLKVIGRVIWSGLYDTTPWDHRTMPFHYITRRRLPRR